jgi:hypothetical protein
MDDQTPANESNDQGLNKIDLSQLQDFTFGTQWTEAKVSPPSQRRDRDFDRGPGGDRRRDGGAPGDQKRDRRGFRKPLGAPAGPGSGGGAGDQGQAAPRPGDQRGPGPGQGQGYGQGQGQGDFNRGAPRPFRGNEGGGFRGNEGGGFRGGPRRDFQGGGQFQGGGPRRDFRGGEGGGQFERGLYISPYFVITCYPEDAGFAAIVKAVRASCRTFQLFEITKAVLEKNERFVMVIQRKPPGAERSAPPASRDSDQAAPAAAEPTAPAKPQKATPLFLSQPDHLPFETEDAAIQHVLKNHLGLFFETAEVEIEAPKGNFPIINKCSITGELLGPPNYHLYQQILQQHHAARLSRMPFEKFRDSIVSIREPEVAQQWLDKMKKTMRFTWKPVSAATAKAVAAPAPMAEVASAAPAPEAPADAAPAEVTPTSEVPAASVPETAPAPAPETTPASASEGVPAAPAGPSFDSYEEARAYLLANAKDKVVRVLETIRFHGKLLEKLPPGEIKRAIEGHIERQRRFPLDTANALRGRLRREGFTIFKKGSRGVSYVCAVKRRFRVPGQVFSDSITSLIEFIEKNPLVHGKDLPLKFLNIDVAAAVAAHPLPEGTSGSQAPFAALPADQSERMRRMANDLRWLVTEGYVTEFSDGTFFAPPPVTPQAAKKAEEQEHDPEDFPQAPAAAAATESAPATESAAPMESAPAESTAPATESAEPTESSPTEFAPAEPAPIETAPSIPEPAPDEAASTKPAPPVAQ